LTEEIAVSDRRFRLMLPASPDAFLDDPDVQQANRETDYMPYWAYLWPAARKMASHVLNERWQPGASALELGSGIGLVGIAALTAGLRVTFSDYDRTSLSAATQNARLNHVEADAAELLDWRNIETAGLRRHFPVILGCDVLYEVSLHAPLLNVIDCFLADGGVCWLGDPGRTAIRVFCAAASERGYAIEVRDERGELCPATAAMPAAFRLLVLSRHESQDAQATKSR
jgi:predicted nicotinamide N-methyase